MVGIKELISNVVLLMALCTVYEVSYIIPTQWKKVVPFVKGILIGFIGLAIMSIPFNVTDGIIVDTRSILIGVTALTFGFIPTAIASSITILYRISMGGAGLWTGIASIITSAMIGMIWRKHSLKFIKIHRWLRFYLLGVFIHLVMLACFVLTPWIVSIEVLKVITLPVMLIYPIATVLLSLLLMHQVERNEAHTLLFKTNQALQESEKRFRLLIDSAPDAIFIESDGKFVFVNSVAVHLFGAQDALQLINTPVLDRFHPDYHDTIRMRMSILKDHLHDVPPVEEVFLKIDGTTLDVDINAVPIYYNHANSALVFARDITERKILENRKNEIEAQLHQQQKLEAIGTLAGGVAHEINNPINGIMNYAQLILDGIDKTSEQAEFAREIIHESDRISIIVRNLLHFSRQEKQSYSYASMYDIIDQTVTLIKTIIKKDQIQLDIVLDPNLPDIKCRSQQIQQVLMNLLTNARDALNEKYIYYHKDKVIRLRCRNYFSEGNHWIRLTVEDNGNGIPMQYHDKLFEPFFSTKPKDKGTGLGLSISFGIIKDHHGEINIDTKEGHYTRFTLDLPVDNGWSLNTI